MKIVRPIALLFFLFFTTASYAVVAPPEFNLTESRTKAIEKITGKKLTWFQKSKLKILLKALRKFDERTITQKQKRQANASLILGISSMLLFLLAAFTSAGILALSIPAALIAVILGARSRKGNFNVKG